jgi:hypothetical protein
MKKTGKILITILFFVLVVANLLIFVSGMNLSQKISYFEQETKRLRRENISLQKKAYEADSLQFAASVAAQLNFAQKAEPYFLENLGFALRK